METKHFPNGFDNWAETHYEISSFINKEAESDETHSHVINLILAMDGTGGLYELATELTDEFEALHEGKVWDGEWHDEIDSFLSHKLY